MNRLAFALSVIAVVASATWAYNTNYRTKTALGRVDELRGKIAAEREAAEVLRVEWAYLNAPERLARLVELNSEWLKLEPMGPQGFDEVPAIPFPPRTAAPGSEPGSDDAAPAFEPEPVHVIMERVPLVTDRVPVPAPRPVGWGLE
jgi:hypothetical protein